jgi:hypothetical protein
MFANHCVKSTQKAIDNASLDVVELKNSMFAADVSFAVSVKLFVVVFVFEDIRDYFLDLSFLDWFEQRLFKVHTWNQSWILAKPEHQTYLSKILLLVVINEQRVCCLHILVNVVCSEQPDELRNSEELCLKFNTCIVVGQFSDFGVFILFRLRESVISEQT